MSAIDRDQVVSHVCRQLRFDLGDEFAAETIQRCVADSFESLRNARVQTYVPLLLHRSAKARLRADATAGRIDPSQAPNAEQHAMS
jgi:hypothetical protein